MERLTKIATGWIWILLWGWTAHATEPVAVDGSSTPEVRQHAIRQIPLKQLNEQAKQKLLPVLEDPSLFRRMPAQTIHSDPEMLTFLVRYPEVLVNIWDIMGITKVTVNRLNPYVFQGKDGAGTECKAELIYGTDDLHIYYGTGSYDGTLVGRELKGRCVCVLHSKPTNAPNDPSMVSGQMDVFLKLDNVGADIIAKTLGPFVGKTADGNFVESAKFVSQLSQAAEHNPMGVQQLASKMNKIQPTVRDQFIQVAHQVAQRSKSNQLSSPSNQTPATRMSEELLNEWKQSSRVPERDLHLRSLEKTESALRR
ncbi:MAG: hypothetical protein U0905_19735 [Pirellulales bacterium]